MIEFTSDQKEIIFKEITDAYSLEERLSKICNYINRILFIYAIPINPRELLPKTRTQDIFLEKLALDSFHSQDTKTIFSYLENSSNIINSTILDKIPTQSDGIAAEWLFTSYNPKFYIDAILHF